MVVTGGENVLPTEVEGSFYGDPDRGRRVRDPDPQWVERVVAAVVLKPGARATGEELIRRLRASLRPKPERDLRPRRAKERRYKVLRKNCASNGGSGTGGATNGHLRDGRIPQPRRPLGRRRLAPQALTTASRTSLELGELGYYGAIPESVGGSGLG